MSEIDKNDSVKIGEIHANMTTLMEWMREHKEDHKKALETCNSHKERIVEIETKLKVANGIDGERRRSNDISLKKMLILFSAISAITIFLSNYGKVLLGIGV